MPYSLSNFCKKLTDRLVAYNDSGDYVLPSPEKSRWITHSETDKEQLQSATFADSQQTYSVSYVKCARPIINNEMYLSCIWPIKVEGLPPGMEIVEETVPLFLLSSYAMQPDIKETEAKVYNALADQRSGVAGYVGHELKSFSELFVPITYYRINDQGMRSWTMERCFSHAAVHALPAFPLRHSPDVMSLYKDLISSGVKHVPYDEIAHSLFSSHWKHVFLDLYRCIEYVFPARFFGEFLKNNSVNIKSLDFARAIEKDLSYRPPEKASMDKLFSILSNDCINLLRIAVNGNANEGLESLAKKFYDLRNRVVHSRGALGNVELDQNTWNSITKFCLKAINELYNKLDSSGDCFP